MEDEELPPGAKPSDVADDVPIMASEGDIMIFSCSACKTEKESSEFSPRKDRSKGFHYACKMCLATQAQKRRDLGLVNVDREAAKIRSRLWRKNKPGHRNALKAAYKSAKNGATPKWLSEKQLQEIVNFYDLAKELQNLSGDQYQVDHIIPVRGKTVCGLHVPWNLQILPSDLNRKKSNSYG